MLTQKFCEPCKIHYSICNNKLKWSKLVIDRPFIFKRQDSSKSTAVARMHVGTIQAVLATVPQTQCGVVPLQEEL